MWATIKNKYNFLSNTHIVDNDFIIRGVYNPFPKRQKIKIDSPGGVHS